MCERCIEKYQGMPLATAENEIVLRQAKCAELLNLLGSLPTPEAHVENDREFAKAYVELMDLGQYVQAAKAGKRQFLNPEADGIVISTSPFAKMFGLPPKVITNTWEMTVNSRTLEGRANLRKQQGLPPFEDEKDDGLDLPPFLR